MAACATLDSAAAGDTTTAVGGGVSLQVDSIPIVDLRLLSQSELYSLSLCSSSTAFNLNRCDDVVIPKIDRSVFNESAGSRKQTYSRLRLAPPSSSVSAAPRRRTPHLRTTAATFANSSSNNFDPENAENAHIVTLLKSLFASDENAGELVPVRIDYCDSASNLGKRKREMLENEIEISVVDVNDNVNVCSSNVEDMDKEVLNMDGVAVDLVALGAVEHPYSEEIKQRTQLLGTEEELLGFLKGLNGQWGSRRKKKRIVDASDFGTALPVGWKLLLSVKKKNALVWLYCRRYLSPSGRQFVSCKEVSSYLLSLHGIKETTTPCTSAQHDESGAADKLTSTSIADLATQDVERKDNLVLHTPPPALVTTSGNHDVQIIPDAGDLPKERLGETLHCKKCNITFSEKNELLQHKSSLHRKTRSRNGVKITDGVIIKDGKYECQFCHKTFDERHRYNGHVGAHVRYQKIAGESSQTVAGEGSLGVQDTKTKGSDNVPEFFNVSINNGLNSFSPSYEDNDIVRDLREANENMRVIDVATDLVTSTSPRTAAETNLSGNENKSSHNETHGIMNAVLEISASMEKPKQDMVSESSLFDSTNHVEACVTNVLKDGDKFSANESMFDFFGSCDPLDKDVAVGVNQASNFEDLPCKTFGTTDNTLTSIAMESKLNLESNVSLLGPPQDDRARPEVGKYAFDEIYSFETPCEEGSSKADNIAISRQEEMHSGSDSVIPSWSEQKNVHIKYNNIEPDRVCSDFASESGKQFCTEENIFNSALKEHKQQPSRTTSVLLGESGVSQVPGEAYTVNNKTYATTKISEIANTGKHDELSLSFGDLQTGLLSNSNRDLNIISSDLKQGRHFGIDFFDSSSNTRSHELDGSFTMSQPGSDWNGPTRDNITTSAQKYMLDFGNTGDIIADGSWSIGQPNVFQGSFDATASNQPSSCFGTFDLTSYKGEEGSSFGVNNNYDIRSDILRPNRSEPVEYSFMGNEGSNSLPGETKVLSHNANMEGGLNSTPFWLGNNTLERNHQVTSVCVWCRNIFYEEQVSQTVGAIGSLCPSCSSRIPGGQFNVL